MKSGLIVFVVFVGLLLFSGCKDAKTGIVIPETAAKYPFATGSEWNYNYSTIVSYYNDHAQIIRDSVFEQQNAIVRVSNIDDSLPNLPHLIKVETFSQPYANAKETIWYQQTDSALYWVAYNNTGAVPWVFPSKENNGIQVLQNHFLIEFPKITAQDTAYFSGIRKVYAFPFTVGNSWIDEIDNGWKRKKTIISSESISIPFKNSIATFLIQTTDPNYRGLKILDWVSLDIGLVKREIIADSVGFIGPDSPEPLYWGKMVSRAELVGKK